MVDYLANTEINSQRIAAHIIPLEEVTLELLPETLQAKNRWMIKTAKKSFVTRFSALTRRHHCRKCGFVVCAECSRERCLLPRLSPKPLRGSGDGDWPSRVEFYASGASWSSFHS
ncbi:hypothetical protein E2I00_001325 [Balaenoptera physalus]|uniref:FYVE zinc finger domain-containing protein n=1 Tax=Balaenoptera physalus TaxID=9770 RepID=A0A643BN74_BALPH|nr:hypothetical protein E2I00_001325 [Balaenoptera physalus]